MHLIQLFNNHHVWQLFRKTFIFLYIVFCRDKRLNLGKPRACKWRKQKLKYVFIVLKIFDWSLSSIEYPLNKKISEVLFVKNNIWLRRWLSDNVGKNVSNIFRFLLSLIVKQIRPICCLNMGLDHFYIVFIDW